MLTPHLRLVRPVNDGRGLNVWLADHLALARRVEVTFAQSTTNDVTVARDELAAQARAFRERAGVAARIGDPHVVLVLEQGEVGGVPFVVTKALEGKSLRQRLLHGPASLDEVERVVRDAASVLFKAHSLGIAHGHLRPDCLFSTDIGADAFLDITGFGEIESAASGYSSPEQLLHGTASDVRSDLWSLAVTVYELLTTTLPFEAATPAGVTVAICNAQFTKPSHYRADLPPRIGGWFDAAFAKDPASRFRDAAEFARAFESAIAVGAAAISGSLSGGVAPPLPDASLDLDDPLEDGQDDEDDDEKTVKWDMPEDARAIARAPLAASIVPPALAPNLGLSAAPNLAPNLAMVSKPGPVSAPPRPTAASAALPVTLPMTPLMTQPAAPPAAVPPMLEPGVYADSPYMASVMPALAVPSAAAPERAPAGVGRRWFGIEGPLLTPDKTWLAALAFAAGVAVTWFAYEPEPEGEAVTSGAGRGDGPIRTVSVDDLPRVEGDEAADLPRIIQTSQLPRAADDVEDGEPVSGRGPASERRGAPAQRVQALAPAPAPVPPRASSIGASSVGASSVGASSVGASSAGSLPKPPAVAVAAAATPARAKSGDTTSNCNPPYYIDSQGIRRLKSECLNGTGVIQGPYGAVITTNVAAKAATSGKSTTDKQARAGTSCSPPYYFDGKIRRLKLECL